MHQLVHVSSLLSQLNCVITVLSSSDDFGTLITGLDGSEVSRNARRGPSAIGFPPALNAYMAPINCTIRVERRIVDHYIAATRLKWPLYDAVTCLKWPLYDAATCLRWPLYDAFTCLKWPAFSGTNSNTMFINFSIALLSATADSVV